MVATCIPILWFWLENVMIKTREGVYVCAVHVEDSAFTYGWGEFWLHLHELDLFRGIGSKHWLKVAGRWKCSCQGVISS